MLDTLFQQPIAHRGYHDADRGCIENTPSAIKAAMEHDFAIEVDVQETADGEALVFHDYTLDRLAEGTGKVLDLPSTALTGLSMRTGGDRLWLLQDLFDLVQGKVPLVIEIKSWMKPGAQNPFVRNVVDQVAAYQGPAAIKSFDPDMLGVARAHNPSVLRGIVADSMPARGDSARLSQVHRFALRHMLHFPRTRPHFVSYSVRDLPAVGPSVLRRVFKRPIMAWTVRTTEDRQRAAQHADQIVFEGFDPDNRTQ
ncbi:glycerophosphoryl diester phosphodiesterase [Roseibium aquae]|uniref:Glycerophosphoryl diester phosphodiesterase n=1 Tax=Roseibium aquae TaxID=1323746 RepID=A0A916TN98_9HYPH|nr:glycerophosphodiester phosphodiesterase family protein [Roseibium aquae]GGB58692.1 glycerophosphoryl diester phosphodiesterase [Roseibium aquae]